MNNAGEAIPQTKIDYLGKYPTDFMFFEFAIFSIKRK